MIKHFFALLCAVLALGLTAAAADCAPSINGPLHVEGTRLVGLDGSPIQLNGLSTHGLAWFPQYVNADFFSELRRDFGVNAIRLAMYSDEYGGYCSGGNKAQLKQLVLSGVQYAKAADLYVIIDWHILRDSDPNIHAAEAIAFFDEMSRLLADETHVLYELCNEPNGATTWQDVKRYAEQVIPVIRANAPDAVIIVGTPSWSQRVEDAAADPILGYDNLMYTLHFYAATHGQWLRDTMTSALSQGFPIMVTEYGSCDASGDGFYDFDQADAWADLMNEQGVSNFMWALANKNEKASIFQASCKKVHGFGWNDLTPAGQWLVSRLGGALADAQNEALPVSTPALPGGNLCRQECLGAWVDDTSGADADVTVKEGSITVDIRNSTSDKYRVQPSCGGITLEQGKSYTLSFSIASSKDLYFDVQLQQNYGSYSAYYGCYELEALSEPQAFSFTFTMQKPSDDNVSLVFNVGGRGNLVYSVSVTEISLTEND